MNKNDGGPAFPTDAPMMFIRAETDEGAKELQRVVNEARKDFEYTGMTLRDYVIVHAGISWEMAGEQAKTHYNTNQPTVEQVSRVRLLMSRIYADDFIKMREEA